MDTQNRHACPQDEGFRILKSRRAVGKIVFTLSDDAATVPVTMAEATVPPVPPAEAAAATTTE